jgi:hypothetical protein
MSALARQNDQAARRLSAKRVRAAGRSRRANEGTVTEMALSLSRDARRVSGGEVECARVAAPEGIRVRRVRAVEPARVAPAAFAARRA